jgi:hypothetical protein
MTQTLDHVVVVHILIWDKRKSQINKYIDIWKTSSNLGPKGDGYNKGHDKCKF